ncbi:MAG: hypothetical protein ACLR3S_00910 [Clostridium fessum]
METYAREAEKRGGTYGYVVLIGNLTAADRAGRAAQMTAAKQLLSAHGTLIAAASNWFGVKYMAGAERETGALSWNEMKQLLPGGNFTIRCRITGRRERFFRCLSAEKGDLTGVLPVYDCPQYMLMDMGRRSMQPARTDGFRNLRMHF